MKFHKKISEIQKYINLSISRKNFISQMKVKKFLSTLSWLLQIPIRMKPEPIMFMLWKLMVVQARLFALGQFVLNSEVVMMGSDINQKTHPENWIE